MSMKQVDHYDMSHAICQTNLRHVIRMCGWKRFQTNPTHIVIDRVVVFHPIMAYQN